VSGGGGRAGNEKAAAGPRLSLLIPCYNEEVIVERTWRRLTEVCRQLDMSYEIVFGDDGSTDRTLALLQTLAEKDENVRVTGHFPNRGAGYTYRQLYRESRGELLIQLDADLAMPPEEALPRLLAALEGADIAVGSRYAGVRADYPLLRRVFSRGYRWLTHVMFDLDVADTQTGFLGFHRRVLDSLQPESDGFEMLLELFVQAQAAGLRMVEVGLPWRHDTSSGETPVFSESLKMLKGTIEVKRRMRRRTRRRKRGGGPA